MAGGKRVKPAAASAPRRRRPSSGAAKPPKPSQIFVEVDSEDEKAKQPPKEQRGVLRGLDPNAVIRSTQTQRTVEISDDESDDGKTHTTRASRNGRSNVNYDTRYHKDYDEALRPKYVARRTGSRSLSTSMKPDRETSEEPSQARSSSEESAGSEPESAPPTTTQRQPDPQATRHSARSEARKAVNYSKKFHPQDYGLPGHQHKAVRNEATQEVKKRKRTKPSDDHGEDTPIEINSSPPRKARKSLKSISSPTNLSSGSVKSGRPSKLTASHEMSNGEMSDYLRETAGDDGLETSEPTQELADAVTYHLRKATQANQPLYRPAVAQTEEILPRTSGPASDTAVDDNDGYMAATDISPLEHTALEHAYPTPQGQLVISQPEKKSCGTQTDAQRNANITLTPESSHHVLVVKPYLEGHPPTLMDLDTVGYFGSIRQQLPLPDPYTQPPAPTQAVNHDFSSSSPASKTLQHVLTSSLASARRQGGEEKVQDSSSTLAMSPTLAGVPGLLGHSTEFEEQMAITPSHSQPHPQTEDEFLATYTEDEQAQTDSFSSRVVPSGVVNHTDANLPSTAPPSSAPSHRRSINSALPTGPSLTALDE